MERQFIIILLGLCCFEAAAASTVITTTTPETPESRYNESNGTDVQTSDLLEYIMPYIPAINDTVHRLLSPLRSEVKNDTEATMKEVVKPINDTVQIIQSNITKLDSKIDSKFDLLDSKFDLLNKKFDAQSLKITEVLHEIRGMKWDIHENKKANLEQFGLVNQQLNYILNVINKNKTSPTPIPHYQLQQSDENENSPNEIRRQQPN